MWLENLLAVKRPGGGRVTGTGQIVRSERIGRSEGLHYAQYEGSAGRFGKARTRTKWNATFLSPAGNVSDDVPQGDDTEGNPQQPGYDVTHFSHLLRRSAPFIVRIGVSVANISIELFIYQ